MSNDAYDTDLCRCCHAEGVFPNVYAPYIWQNEEEVVYADILRECFAIELFPVSEPNHQNACTICHDCIEQLHGAMYFKKQVQKCEMQFRELYKQHVIGDFPFEVEIKGIVADEEIEASDTQKRKYKKSASAASVKRTVKTPNSATKKKQTEPQNKEVVDAVKENNREAAASTSSVNNDDQELNTISDGGKADARRFDDDFDDMGLLSDREEAIFTELKAAEMEASETQKRKKKTPNSATKKKTNSATKKKGSEQKKEEVVEVLEGGIDVVKRPPGIVRMQEDVDYKRVGKLFSCCRCEKSTKNMTTLRCHIKHFHMNIPRYNCPVCSQGFETLVSFVKHKYEEHNIDDSFKCNACDKTFYSKIHLRRHVNSFHMLGKKYKCTVCDFEGFSSATLYKHMFNHKTVKDYHCQYCKKPFMRRSNLKFHERIHTGDKRKVCKVCSKAFVQKASLNYHMSKYHPEIEF